MELYYHPQSPLSAGVRMLIRELGLECKEHMIDFMKQEQTSDTYKKINPHMQVPLLKDGDMAVSESRAIAIYLCKKYDKSKKLYPTEIVQNTNMNVMLFRDFDHFRWMYDLSDARNILVGKSCGPIEDLYPKRATMLAEYDSILKTNNYMFGNDFTLLDIFATATMWETLLTGFNDLDAYPNLKKWQERMSKRPYYEEIVAKPLASLVELYIGICKKNADAMQGK